VAVARERGAGFEVHEPTVRLRHARAPRDVEEPHARQRRRDPAGAERSARRGQDLARRGRRIGSGARAPAD
jgi:hypothetical protein